MDIHMDIDQNPWIYIYIYTYVDILLWISMLISLYGYLCGYPYVDIYVWT